MRRASQTADVIRVGSMQLYHLDRFWLGTIEKNVTAITGTGSYFQNSLLREIPWKIGKGREGYVEQVRITLVMTSTSSLASFNVQGVFFFLVQTRVDFPGKTLYKIGARNALYEEL